MTKNGKIITGVVTGAVVLGGIGAVMDKNEVPNDISEKTTAAIVETNIVINTSSIETTIKEVITSVKEKETAPEKTDPPVTSTAGTTSNPAPIVTQAPPKQNVIYIAASGNGKKYHSNPNCSKMNGNVIEMTKEQAEEQGYTPCQKNTCYG